MEIYDKSDSNKSDNFFDKFSKKIVIKQQELDEYEKEMNKDNIKDNDSDINDNRKHKDFTSTTFSGFKKSDVFKSLLESLIYSKIEPANYWCAELICSKYYDDVWYVFIEFYCKYIHIINIKICIYLEKKHLEYSNIKSELNEQFIHLRNNITIRKIYSEIIFILCDAIKKAPLTYVKINKDDYKIDKLKLHFKAPSKEYIEDIYYEDDPKEYIVSMNEFSYHLHNNNKNAFMAYFWLEWILGFETLKTNKNINYECVPRDFILLDDKYKTEIIWIIWDIFLAEIKKINSKILDTVMDSLLYLFCVNYTKSCYRKRKYILYLIINIICNIDTISFEQPILNKNKEAQMIYTVDNINLIYLQIKKYEKNNSLLYF